MRYFSDTDGKVNLRFLKALVFGHAFAGTIADEMWRTLPELGLPFKNLLSISSDGPNVNKAIKANINTKQQGYFKRQLVDTGSCQLHVVHNAFRKGIEAYCEDVEHLYIDLFHFFKLSPCR